MASLRITSGSLRGRRLPLPPHHHRPTSEKARQAFFNIAGPVLHGARFLDLFCGSGVFSVEAISRGATGAVAVDESHQAIRAIKTLAAEWELPVTAIQGDVLKTLPRLEGRFDVVYADPPYAWAHHGELLRALDTGPVLASGALVAIEHERGDRRLMEVELGRLEFRKTVEHGSVAFTLFDGAANE